jgi:putative membrane protein
LQRSGDQIVTAAHDGVRALRASAIFLVAAGVLTVVLVKTGPLSLQMLLHLGLMSVLAPLAATLLPPRDHGGSAEIWGASLLQMLLLWAWHAPALQMATSQSLIGQASAALLLGISALWFWRAVLAASNDAGWRSLAALLLTGKIACLLGALLIFAPRDLYQLSSVAFAWCQTGPSNLGDQQLAGLLMVTACPLSYLVAGVVLASGMLRRLDRNAEEDDVSPRTR